MSQVESKILHRLQEWEQKEGKLPRLIQFYAELLQIQSEAKSRITIEKPSFGTDLIQDRLSEGTPLLLFEDFSPDWHQVRMVFDQVTTWASKDSTVPPEEKEKLRKISGDIPRLKKSAEVWYLGYSLKDMARTEGVDCELLSSVIAATLKPFLAVYANLLLPEVDQESWRRRYCPICGGSPDFAYLDKDRGARWLVCFRCDAEWLFLRLECPYCDTQKQDSLAYFTDEEESHPYRLYVCDECHTYIKAIDLRRTGLEVLLPLERLMTLDMDRQAHEAGYKAGGIVAFDFR